MVAVSFAFQASPQWNGAHWSLMQWDGALELACESAVDQCESTVGWSSLESDAVGGCAAARHSGRRSVDGSDVQFCVFLRESCGLLGERVGPLVACQAAVGRDPL